jgi:hypothetical protein
LSLSIWTSVKAVVDVVVMVWFWLVGWLVGSGWFWLVGWLVGLFFGD